MQCTSPIFLLGKGTFPCGKCLSCRIAKSREWSARLMQELNYWKQAVFITLTYDDEHLPNDFGLNKKHLQLFFKRLRKSLGDKKIKYFACGEYGDENIDKKTGLFKYPTKLGRPHYHAIVFGLGRDKQSKELIKSAWRLCLWDNFRDSLAFGTVTADSCRYVSDYIFKKYDNKKAKEVYGSVQIPFRLCSLGLGLDFCLDNADQLKRDVGFTLNGVHIALPRYYVDKLGLKLEHQDEVKINQWRTYSKKVYKDDSLAKVSDLYYEHMEQRAVNVQARADLHKKGKL